MTKLPYIMLAVALTGALVGFSDLSHISNGLGKAVFAVCFSLAFITSLVGRAEADHEARTALKSVARPARSETADARAEMGLVQASSH